MKENLVSLAKLLATDDAFNLAFSSRGTDEEKYELAKTKFTDLTREDFSEFMEKLREAEKANLAELSPDELEMVAGGAGGWATKLAAAAMFVTALGATGVMSQQVDASDPETTVTATAEGSAGALAGSGATDMGMKTENSEKKEGKKETENEKQEKQEKQEMEKMEKMEKMNENKKKEKKKEMKKKPEERSPLERLNNKDCKVSSLTKKPLKLSEECMPVGGLPKDFSSKGVLALLAECDDMSRVQLEINALQVLAPNNLADGDQFVTWLNNLPPYQRTQLSTSAIVFFKGPSLDATPLASTQMRTMCEASNQQDSWLAHLYGEFNAAGQLTGGGHLSDTKTYLVDKDNLTPTDLGNGVCFLANIKSPYASNKFKTFFPDDWDVKVVKDVATTVKKDGYQVTEEKRGIVWNVASVTHQNVNINVVVGVDLLNNKITTCFPLSDQKDASQHVLCDDKKLNKKVLWFLPGWNTNPASTKDFELGTDVHVFAPDGSTFAGSTIASNRTQFTITNSTCTMTKSDGSRTEYRPDGSRTEYRPDGSRIEYSQNGRNFTSFNANGEMDYSYVDLD